MLTTSCRLIVVGLCLIAASCDRTDARPLHWGQTPPPLRLHIGAAARAAPVGTYCVPGSCQLAGASRTLVRVTPAASTAIFRWPWEGDAIRWSLCDKASGSHCSERETEVGQPTSLHLDPGRYLLTADVRFDGGDAQYDWRVVVGWGTTDCKDDDIRRDMARQSRVCSGYAD